MAWISIKTRAPKPNERVLVYRPSMVNADIGPISIQWGWSCKAADATFWQPLPEEPNKNNIDLTTKNDHMDEYVKRAAVVQEILGLTIMDSAVAAYADAVLYRVQHIPAADVEPVVHGRWIAKKGGITGGGNPLWCCSNCGYTAGASLIPPKYNGCPSCRAKMEVK